MRHLGALVWLVAAIVVGVPNRAAAQTNPELAGTGTLVLSVESSRELLSKLRDAARAVGGQLVHATETELTIDVPRASTSSFVERLAKIAPVQSQQLASEDITDQIAEAEASARSARESHERLARSGVTARDMNERILLERELEQTQNALATAEARLRELRRRATMTRITIHLSAPPRPESIEPARLPFPWLEQLDLGRLLNPPEVGEAPPVPNQEPQNHVLREFAEGALELRLGYVPHSEKLDDTKGFIAAAVSFRMLGEAAPIGLFGGFDLVLGGGGGFVYGAQGLLGLGAPIGSAVAIGLSGGPGIDGITGGVVPFGLDLPIEFYLMLEPAPFLTAGIWVRDGWVLLSEERKHGADHALFGDELSAGITLGIGAGDDDIYSHSRVGIPFAGVAYRELMGTEIYEFFIGWGAHETSFSF